MMRKLYAVILSLYSFGAWAQNEALQLHELYEPPPVKFTFETPGWYILAAVIFVFACVLVILQVRKYIKNHYRREALYSLENTANSVPQIFMILKNTAMFTFGREQTGALYGREWLDFLDKTGKNVQMAGFQEHIAKAIYEGKEIDREIQNKILSNAKKWVKTHAG